MNLDDYTPDQLEDFSKKVSDFLPEIKRILPELKQQEAEYRAENKLTKDDHIFYTLMITKDKIIVYVFAGIITTEVIEVMGMKIGKGAVINHKCLKKIEVISMLGRISEEGLVKVMAEYTVTGLIKKLDIGK